MKYLLLWKMISENGFHTKLNLTAVDSNIFFFYEDNRQLYMYLSEHTVDVSLLWPPVPLAVTCV